MNAYKVAIYMEYIMDIQASGYSEWLRNLITNQATEYADYVILPYLFTDISRVDKTPVTYEYDPTFEFSYTCGDKTYSYKGWRELLGEILTYEANNAKVPNYIKTDGPNDLREVLNNNM